MGASSPLACATGENGETSRPAASRARGRPPAPPFSAAIVASSSSQRPSAVIPMGTTS